MGPCLSEIYIRLGILYHSWDPLHPEMPGGQDLRRGREHCTPGPPATPPRLRPLICDTGTDRRTATTQPSGKPAGEKYRVLKSEAGPGPQQLLSSWRSEASSGTIGPCGHRAGATHFLAWERRELIPTATF